MKKILFLTTLAVILVFTSCSSDDDGGSKCDSCTVERAKVEFCDNADGTYTVKSGGEEKIYTSAELEASGLTFTELKDLTCSLSI